MFSPVAWARARGRDGVGVGAGVGVGVGLARGARPPCSARWPGARARARCERRGHPSPLTPTLTPHTEESRVRGHTEELG